MAQAVIFDCFGVIIGQGFEHTYRLAGGDPLADQAFITDLLGQANLGIISEADFHKAVAKQLHIDQAAWHQAMREAEKPDQDLLDYIRDLRTNYKTAVLSNANHGVLAARIGEARLNECFDEVVVSAEEGVAKPDPRIYVATADRLGVAPEQCIFFDDNDYQLAPARELGMQAFQYTSFEQAKADLARLMS